MTLYLIEIQKKILIQNTLKEYIRPHICTLIYHIPPHLSKAHCTPVLLASLLAVRSLTLAGSTSSY